MIKKWLSFMLVFVMVLSTCLTPAYAQLGVSSESLRATATDSDKESEYNRYEQPDLSNPYGADKASDSLIVPQLMGPQKSSATKSITSDEPERVIIDNKFKDSDRNPDDSYQVGERSYENPFGATRSENGLQINEGFGINRNNLGTAQESYGEIALNHLEKLSDEIGPRPCENEENKGEETARDYIKQVFEDLGYTVDVQHFEKTVKSDNVIAVKLGKSDKVVIVGAHYDSVSKGKGADDNASGVSIMLEAAEKLVNVDTPYTIKFVAFGAEEKGLLGSKYYVSQMTDEDISNTVAMINIDSCIAGDNMYVYGGAGDKGWLREKALEIAKNLKLDLQTQTSSEEYPAGTTGDWSDHAPFKKAGIPFAYFEATNWDLGKKDGYTQVPVDKGDNGEIWHTQYDNIEYINENFPGRIEERLNTFTAVLTNLLVKIEKPGIGSMQFSRNLVSLTEAREIEITVDFGYKPDLDKLQWTLGGKAFSDWKKYSDDGEFQGDPFITFRKEAYLDGSTVKAVIKFDKPYGDEDVSTRGGIRETYPSLLGNYDLKVTDTNKDQWASMVVKINVYDSYRTYDEIKSEIDKITQKAKSNRYVEYKSLGKSVQGREVHFVILAKDKASVEKYLDETLPMMTSTPKALQDKIKNGTIVDYKIPIWFNNIHPDEAPGIDAIIELFEKFATQDEVTYMTADSTDGEYNDSYGDKYGTNFEVKNSEKSVKLDVKEALDNVIFLFNFTENPDGRALNTRENANGFDLNRDNAYQTQIEARLTTSEIAKWKPTSFLDFHGFVDGFLIEPCTTPHDPNFEYDLLINSMLEQAYVMGKAGIGSTKYIQYEIPYEDHPGGWDDGTPSYTATYAMFHGSIAHTIEIPDLDQNSHNALVATGLASTKYVVGNKNKLFENQLEYYRRGIENIDAKETVDPYLLNANGEKIGRPRGNNENFFPEYYVIPVDKSIQNNALEAYKMAEYLIRNDVKVERSTEEVKIGETTYPSGSFIVNMRQAVRGYANCVLYDGYDVSDFSVMYAEIVMNFHDARGFNRYEIRVPGAFNGKTQEVIKVEIPHTNIAGDAVQYVIRNTNNDAIKAVNKLLSGKKSVKILLSNGNGYEAGDYLVTKEDINSIKDKYFFDVVNYDNASLAREITKPLVAAQSASGHLAFALNELGFEIVSSTKNGNVIVTDSSANVKSSIDGGIPYIGIGGKAMGFMKNTFKLPGFNYTNSGYEGLIRGKVDQDSFITSGYDENDIIYNPKGGYISAYPESAKVLTNISNEDNYLKAGWWPDGTDAYGKLAAKGKALAINVKAGSLNITLFANNLVNKAHPQKDWRMLANAIFTSNMDIDSSFNGMKLSSNIASISESKVIDVEFSFDAAVNANNIEWTLGGKSFSDWKKYDFDQKSYTGAPFITFAETPVAVGKTVKAKIKFDLPYDTSDLSGNARRLYPSLIGKYELVAKDKASAKMVKATIKYNAYDSYHSYDEIKPAIDKIFMGAKENRYLEYKSLGKSVEGRDAHFVILAKNKKAVDQYLNETLPLMLENPKALQDKIANGTMGDYKVPIWFNNIHPDEAPGVDAIIRLLEQFASKDTVEYKTMESQDVPKDKDGFGSNTEVASSEKTVTIDVEKALDNVIFLFNFTENPDGRFWNTRGNVNGFDINRDNAYQTQVEARMTTDEITNWKPLTFLDFHGFVNGFLIEPCTTPHDPNFEYDLLIDNMLEQAHLMGKAGIANTKYTNYEIPYEDHPGGWDDAVPSYTAVYAMAHGALGHTIEIPDLNEASVDACIATGYANVSYVLANKDKLFKNQLEYYRRGIENIDAKDLVDKWMLDAKGKKIGRPRGNNENFFPEYYVIPVDKSVQKNALEAYKMIEYLLRNNVKVEKIEEAVTVSNTIFPAGSFVIDLHQASRGYLNTILFDGYDVSDFAEMYAEIVNVFHDTRGFDRYEVRTAKVFDGKTEKITSITIPKTNITVDSAKYIISNSNNDAVRAVNELLKKGRTVGMLMESGNGYKKGDYVVLKEDLNAVKNNYLLEAAAYNGASKTMILVKPLIAAPSATGHLTFALKELGFDTVTGADKANIIVCDSSANVKEYIDAGKPYVGIGGSAMSFIKNKVITSGFDYINSSYEALMRAEVDQSSIITSGYSASEVIYNAKGGYIKSYPQNAEVLIRLLNNDTCFKAGWWPSDGENGKLAAKGKALAINTKVGNANITIFANNLVNKAHPQKDWRMLANSIFTSLAYINEGGGSSGNGSTGGGSRGKGSSSGSGTSADNAIKSNSVGDIVLAQTAALNTNTGEAKTALSINALNKALAQAKQNKQGVKEVIVQISNIKGASLYSVEFPKDFFQASNNVANSKVNILTELGKLSVQNDMFSHEQVKLNGNVELIIKKADFNSIPSEFKSRIGSRPVISLTVKVAGTVKEWSNSDSRVNVTIDYVPLSQEISNSDFDPDKVVVQYIDNNNKVAKAYGRYDAASKKVTFAASGAGTYAVIYVDNKFTDISKHSWAKREIEIIAAKGIIKERDNDSYDPAANITRAEFVYGLVKALDLNAKIDGNFQDIKTSDYFYKEIAIAKALGIAKGSDNNKFRPTASITRQDMMVLIERALAAAKKPIEGKSDLNSFKDKSGIADYAFDSVSKIVSSEIVKGSGSSLNPHGNTSRAEAAIVLYRIYKK